MSQDNRTCPLPLPGDTCQFAAGPPSHVTADNPIAGLQLLHSGGGTACVTSLVSYGLWRWSYAFSVPTNVTSWGGPSETVFIELVVVTRTGSQTDLLLDGTPFGPDGIQNVFPSNDYVVITKRIEPGFHSVRSSSMSYFGAFLLGAHPRTAFCTTAGLDPSNHSHAVLGEFPIPGNKRTDIDLPENPTATSKTTTSPTISTTTGPATDTTATSARPAGAGPSNTTSPVADAATSTSTQPTSRPSTCNPAAGAAATQLTNMSKDQLAEILVTIRQVLLLDCTKTSSFSRRLSSAVDTRPSCMCIGVVGTVMVASVVLLVVSGDVIHVLVWLWGSIRHRHY